MADCDSRRMLLANGNFLTDGIIGDVKVEGAGFSEEVLRSERSAKVKTGSRKTGPPNIIHPTIDHSYVYNVNSVKYFNPSVETDDSRDAESSEGLPEQISSEETRDVHQEFADSRKYLRALANDDTVVKPQLDPDRMQFALGVSSSEELEDRSVSNPSIRVVSSTEDASVGRSKLGNKSSTAPLGSVENPIQIVQQGNAYRSSQILTKEHVQQIAHVLQQQQLSKAIQNGGKSVLYDQSTNTRIVYRVIYPSELQSKIKSDTEAPLLEAGIGRGKGRPKKHFMKKVCDEEKVKLILSKEEREEKKKHRPRTRSGRISKPPSYMVKDYKRIHHLDFNEEQYDDSDGGYSDYHVSDEEKEKHVKQGSSSETSTAKKRNYSCVSCSKAYIGKGGLSRHYRLNPSHGSLPDREDASTQDENSNSSLASSVFSMPGTSGLGPLNISPVTKADVETPVHQSSFALQDFLAMKRKSKIKDILKSYRDDELAEAILPRLLPSLSLWDLIVAKSKKGCSQQLDISSLFANFEQLLSRMQKVAKNCLSSTAHANDLSKTVIHVTSEEMSKALRINPGTYFIKDSTKSYHIDPHHSYSVKRMDLESSLCQNLNVMITDDLPTSAKLRKLQALEASVIEEPINSTLPDQILSDVQEVDALELNLPSVEFDGSSELQSHDPSQILNPISETADNHEFTPRTFLECSNGVVPGNRLLQTSGNSTTVTPSSLSSGCLSAVDASEALRTHNFITSAAVQLSEMPLFTSALQNFQPETSIGQLQVFNSSPSVKRTNLNSPTMTRCDNQQIITTNSESTLLGFDGSSKLTEVQSQSNADIYCPNIQQSSSVDFSGQAAVSLLQANSVTDMSVMPDCLVNSSTVDDGLCTTSPSINRVLSMGNISNMDDSGTLSYDSAGKCSNLNTVPFNVQTTKSLDGAPVIRQLVLPGGQVIGTWSQVQNQSGYSESLLQETLAPGNLVLVQSPDGSYQVPSEQIVPLETLQALLSGSQTVIKEEDTSSQLI